MGAGRSSGLSARLLFGEPLQIVKGWGRPILGQPPRIVKCWGVTSLSFCELQILTGAGRIFVILEAAPNREGLGGLATRHRDLLGVLYLSFQESIQIVKGAAPTVRFGGATLVERM